MNNFFQQFLDGENSSPYIQISILIKDFVGMTNCGLCHQVANKEYLFPLYGEFPTMEFFCPKCYIEVELYSKGILEYSGKN
jgi:hypothetical protein